MIINNQLLLFYHANAKDVLENKLNNVLNKIILLL